MEFEEYKEGSLEPKVKVSWKREQKMKRPIDRKDISFRRKKKIKNKPERREVQDTVTGIKLWQKITKGHLGTANWFGFILSNWET